MDYVTSIILVVTAGWAALFSVMTWLNTQAILRRRARATVDLEPMSYEALVAVMNALNTSPAPFECPGDQGAFSTVSLQVAQRWTARKQNERLA